MKVGNWRKYTLTESLASIFPHLSRAAKLNWGFCEKQRAWEYVDYALRYMCIFRSMHEKYENFDNYYDYYWVPYPAIFEGCRFFDEYSKARWQGTATKAYTRNQRFWEFGGLSLGSQTIIPASTLLWIRHCYYGDNNCEKSTCTITNSVNYID